MLRVVIFSFLLQSFSYFAFASKYPEYQINSELLSWNSNQKIKLLEHQLKPIDYLEKNPDIKGLLVYHYLGTGKTFLSIGMAERNQSRDVLILVPRFLVTHWQKNLDAYGVKNKSRYLIATQEDPEVVIKKDLSNTIVIIDESHRIINKLSSSDMATLNTYSELYTNLRKADRILSLSGTPIYSNTIDIAYQINLVSGKDLMPLNHMQFRNKFTQVNGNQAFLKGHFLQSKVIVPQLVINVGAFIGSTMIASPMGAAVMPLAAGAGLFLASREIHLDKNSMRSFNAEKLSALTEKYVTYYDFDEKVTEHYPSKKISYQDLSYNDFQVNFLLRFADGALDVSEVQRLQLDALSKMDLKYIHLNSSRIQSMMKQNPMHGLEVGNLIFRNQDGSTLYPTKFAKIINKIKTTDRPVVIYSHFYNNGLTLFKRYLDYSGYKGQYQILDPDLPAHQYEKIISDYNNGKVRILMIHPEITEGISLKGTAQLHILEPSINKAAQEQIIGRVVRYLSHANLQKNQRLVDVYIWKMTTSGMNIAHMSAMRKNWLENFPEFNYYGEQTKIDENSSIKSSSPDERACKIMNQVDENSKELITTVRKLSIENHYKKQN